MKHISIYENGVWSGDGRLAGGYIEDCQAVLGDDRYKTEEAYQAIEDAIDAGASVTMLGHNTLTWDIE